MIIFIRLGYVKFTTTAEAEEAKSKMDGEYLLNRQMKIQVNIK
jgi:hypothetical protein